MCQICEDLKTSADSGSLDDAEAKAATDTSIRDALVSTLEMLLKREDIGDDVRALIHKKIGNLKNADSDELVDELTAARAAARKAIKRTGTESHVAMLVTSMEAQETALGAFKSLSPEDIVDKTRPKHAKIALAARSNMASNVVAAMIALEAVETLVGIPDGERLISRETIRGLMDKSQVIMVAAAEAMASEPGMSVGGIPISLNSETAVMSGVAANKGSAELLDSTAAQATIRAANAHAASKNTRS